MTTVNMLDAKSNLSRLVEAIESGAEREIIIARNGKPAARLVPIHASAGRRAYRRRQGKVHDTRAGSGTGRRSGRPFWRFWFVNLLLNTHITLWAVEDNPRLSQAARTR